MAKNPLHLTELVLTKIVVYGREFDLPPGALSVSLRVVLAETGVYIQERVSLFSLGFTTCGTGPQRLWHMFKNCLASLLSVGFATAGTGKNHGIWPRTVRLPFSVSCGAGNVRGISPRTPCLTSVSLHPVLAKTVEYGQELSWFLI